MRVEHTYIHDCQPMPTGKDIRLLFIEKSMFKGWQPQWLIFSQNVMTHLYEGIKNCPYCGVNLNDELLAYKRDNGV